MKIDKSFLVHTVLGHSYLVYFATLLIGLLIDTKWAYHFNAPFLIPVGFVLLFLGPLLILWAQQTSHALAVKQLTENPQTHTHDFFRGPYTFTRSPTHLGLFLMIIGLGFLLNSISIVATTLLAYIVTRVFFLAKEEALLEEKYGHAYKEYKEQVKKL
jgi:protein-S-isoprenylcysteine O-methyltransferase Ste14